MADHTEIDIPADAIHLTSDDAAPFNSTGAVQSESPAAPSSSTDSANIQPSSSEPIALAAPALEHSNSSESAKLTASSSAPTASDPFEGVKAASPSSSPAAPAAPAAAALDASSSSDSAARTPSTLSVAAPSPQLSAQPAPPSKSPNRITSTRMRPPPPSAFAAYSNLALSQSSHDTSPPSSSTLHDEKAVMDALRIDMNNDAEVETLVAPSAPALRSSSRSKQSSPASSLQQKPWSRPVSSPYGAIQAQSSHPSSVSSTLGKAAFAGATTAVPFLHKASDGSTPSSGSHTNLYDDHDPGRWHTDEKEPDDYLHDPSKAIVSHGFGLRGVLNIGTLAILIMAILMLFMGYPLLTHFYLLREGTKGGFNLGGSNSTGQVPDLASMQMRQSLIDLDTPASAQTKANLGPAGGETWNLMFSDEFNVDGRSFYPGDDPFWEAVNLYAHGTGDYEWYDPAAVTTQGGALTITVIQEETHNLNFRSGQLTSWNQMCFTGGYLEAAVILPGDPDVSGWWPAIWTMGNLGRANYGATTEGTWPYSYDTCDRGTLINQTDADGLGPAAAITSGDETTFNRKYHTRNLSWQPGQKLSACTCPGEDHPGPQNSDGTYKGRSAPEIDMFEAQISGTEGGQLSLSCQFMPANAGYYLVNETGAEYTLETVNGARVDLNSYRGSVLQMSASAVANTNQASYQNAGKVYSIWGFEYEPGPTGYVTWWMDGVKAWTLEASAVGADALAGISQRPIPEEPMYILMNVAISSGFGNVEWDLLKFPSTMEVDYVRLYQAPDKENVGCDPEDYPTSDYINRHIEAYTNPNLTIWGGESATGGYGANWPRNRLYNGGNGCAEAPRNYPGRLRPNGILQYPSDTVPAAYRGSTATDDGDN